MTPAQFIARFPYFEETRPTLVQAYLEDALVDMGGPDYSVWPPMAVPGQPFSLTDRAQGLKAALMLQADPLGAPTRLKPDGSETRWSQEYDRICLQVAGGFVVAGQNNAGGPSSNGQGSLVLTPGAGTISLVNGSLLCTFSQLQTLPAGTIIAPVGSQPGALYALAANVPTLLTGNFTAPYTGPTQSGIRWNFGNA